MTPLQLGQVISAAAGLLNVLKQHNINTATLVADISAAAADGKPFNAQKYIDQAQDKIDQIPTE
jgi:hypothetical protein